MHVFLILVLGLAVGLMAGLMGVGGGIMLVPAFVYLLGMDQHVAQGTSMLILLPPLGLGALALYWRRGRVDLRAGIVSATGFLIGGYFGGHAAVRIPSSRLQGLFGIFVMTAAVILWRKTARAAVEKSANG